MILINMMMAIINLAFEEIKANAADYQSKFALVDYVKRTTKEMIGTKIAEPIGPYTMGRVITMPGVGTWGFSSGCLGMNKKGVIASKKPGL